jgi:hypothetical protein
MRITVKTTKFVVGAGTHMRKSVGVPPQTINMAHDKHPHMTNVDR